MKTTPSNLPPVPRRSGSSIINSLWVVVACWVAYAALLSDFGLLFSCCPAIPDAARVGIKLHPVEALFGGKLLYDLILLLRRRIRWRELPVSFLIFWVAYIQLLILNVSPLD